MRPNLSNVTLCAIDCANVELVSRAIDLSLKEAEFGNAILFTDTKTCSDTKNYVQIEKIENKFDYSRFILKQLHSHIDTDYALIVQWDGYILDGRQWNNDFLNADYIGAPWHWHKDGMNVGNGGFSLRSKRLLELTASPEFPFIENLNEDEQICRINRPTLAEKHSIKFASEKLATQFAYERSLPNLPTLGFHGLFNMWRYLDDDEMIEVVQKFNPYLFHSIEFFELLAQYFVMRKYNIAEKLCTYAKSHCNEIEINNLLKKLTNDHNFLTTFLFFLNNAH